jgi:hypothetical protein
MRVEESPELRLERIGFACGGWPGVSHHDAEGCHQNAENDDQPTGVAGPERSRSSDGTSEDDAPAERKR